MPDLRNALALPARTPPVTDDERWGPPASTLTSREQEVLRLLAEGQTDREIGAALFISPRTVEKHVASLREKLAAPSRTAAVAVATRIGLL